MIDVGYTWLSPKGTILKVEELFKDTSIGRWKAIVTCEECSKDKELFPEIVMQTSVIERGCSGCACNPYHRWSESQHKIRIKRKCEELGYRFLGFQEDFKNNHTKIKLYNPVSGNTWDSCSISNFMRGREDPSLRERRIKSKFEGRRNNVVTSALENYPLKSTMKDITWETENTPAKIKLKIKYFCTNCCQKVNTDICNIRKGKIPCRCRKSGGEFSSRHDEDDNLYLAYCSENKIVKIGRSFTPVKRLREIGAKYEGVWDILYLVKGVHKEIYNLEQEILYNFAENKVWELGEEIFPDGFDCIIKQYLLERSYTLEKCRG